MFKRLLGNLVNRDESAWPLVTKMVKGAKNVVEVLPQATQTLREAALLSTQVTTRSPMGAIVYESGGLLVDHGWLRILGAGHEKLPRSLPDWNKTVGIDLAKGRPGYLLVADDVLGGFYAIDGGVWGRPGHVFYFAPDKMAWEDTGKGYTQFLEFCFYGDLQHYYADVRWPDWKQEVSRLNGDQGLSVYPFLACSGPPVEFRARGVVPMSELYGFLVGGSIA